MRQERGPGWKYKEVLTPRLLRGAARAPESWGFFIVATGHLIFMLVWTLGAVKKALGSKDG